MFFDTIWNIETNLYELKKNTNLNSSAVAQNRLNIFKKLNYLGIISLLTIFIFQCFALMRKIPKSNEYSSFFSVIIVVQL